MDRDGCIDRRIGREQDLGSANGLQVNGSRVQRVRLRHGDLVDVGGPCFLFVEH